MLERFSFAAVHSNVAFATGHAMTGDARVGRAPMPLETTRDAVASHRQERRGKRTERGVDGLVA